MGRDRAEDRRQQREWRNRRCRIALQQLSPDIEAEQGGRHAEIEHGPGRLPARGLERRRDGRGPFQPQRQGQHRRQRHQAHPDDHAEHVDLPRAAQQHVADGPACRGGEDKAQAQRRQIAPDRQPDQPEPGARHRHAGEMAPGGPLAQRDRGKDQGEEGLRLDHDRGQTRRQSGSHAAEQEDELADEQEQPDRNQPPGTDVRTGHEQHRQGRHGKAQHGQQQRRKVVEPNADDDKIETPDRRHQDGGQDMNRFHEDPSPR